LARLLADDLKSALAASDHAPRRVVLWLDPDQQFARLAAAVGGQLEKDGIRLFDRRTSDGQFALKVAVLRAIGEGAPVVVYLPGHAPADLAGGRDGQAPVLWGLVEYRFTGEVWGSARATASGAEPPTLDQWLESHGARYSGGQARASLVAGGADSPLARLAAKFADRGVENLPSPLNSQTVGEALAGEPLDALIDLILDPAATVSRWADERRDVAASMDEHYGLASQDDPEQWAEEVGVQLALLDAWDVFGRSPAFPLLARLPSDADARDQALRTLRRHLLTRPDVTARLRLLASRNEALGRTIDDWALDLPGLPSLLDGLVRRRVERLLDAVRAALASGPADALRLLERQLPAALPGEPQGIELLRRVAQMAVMADAARTGAASARDPAALVQRYVQEWWRLDAEYLAVAASCRTDPRLALVADLAGRVYLGYLDGVNQRFADLVGAVDGWPPSGTMGVTGAAAAVWEPRGKKTERRAVLIIDALRFDVARSIEGRLGTSATLEPVLATLPSTTPFGMTALLPQAPGEMSVTIEAKSLQISASGFPGLQDRAGRKAYLQARVGGTRDAKVAFVELDDVLTGATLADARLTVAFDYALDDKGHSPDSAALPEDVPGYVTRIVRAIERLHDSGVSRVDVLTDHGFLFAPPDLIDGLGHPTLPPVQARTKQARYAILEPGGAGSELAHRSLPLDPSIELALPRGIRTLVKASPYLHGGLSLQECVIPHLVSVRTAAPTRLRAEVSVATAKVSGATIAFTVKPVVDGPPGQLTLESPQPIRVRITAAAGDVKVADPVELELRADTPELRAAVYLIEGHRIAAGTELVLEVVDAESGISYAHLSLTLVVDWE
jgi:hypothetical protein